MWFRDVVNVQYKFRMDVLAIERMVCGLYVGTGPQSVVSHVSVVTLCDAHVTRIVHSSFYRLRARARLFSPIPYL